MLLGLFVVRGWTTGQTENLTMTRTTMNLTSLLQLTEMLCRESQVSIIRLVAHSQFLVVGNEKSLQAWQLWLLAASLSPQWHFAMKNKWREINSCTKSDSFFIFALFLRMHDINLTFKSSKLQAKCFMRLFCALHYLHPAILITTLACITRHPRTCTSAFHLLW